MAPRSRGDILKTMTSDMVFTLHVLKDGTTAYYSGEELVKAIAVTKKFGNGLQQFEGLDKAQSEHKAALVKHIEATNNPHGVNKDQLGLNLVENLAPSPLSSNADGLALASDVFRFTTEQFLAKDAIFPSMSVVLGKEAGHYGGQLGASVLIGAYAGRGGLAEFKDFVSIGSNTHPLASRTISIGNTGDVFSSPKGVVVRADKRDFTDVKDLELGLDFVLKLKPRLATMDLREDYINYTALPLPPDDRPLPPVTPKGDDRNPIYHREWQAYRKALAVWQTDIDTPYQQALATWRKDYRTWQLTNNLTRITTDGSRKHATAQAVLLADEVADAADILKQSFTGVVDFKQLQGLDVKGMRLEEMVPVLVKAMQDLNAYVHSDGFTDRLVGSLLRKGQRGAAALRQAQRAHENQQKEAAQEALVLAEKAASETPPPEVPVQDSTASSG